MQIQDKINWTTILSKKSLISTSIGILLAVVALKGFMVPNNFLDGGVTGISILFRVLFGVDISLFLIVLNLPFIYVGYRKIGKTFAVQTLIAVLLMSLLMNVLPVPVVTEDKVLIAVFGGFLIGLGIGFVIKGGAVIDGLEVIAEYTTKNYGLSSGEMILMVNSMLILGAALQFGLETAMYSILTYFTAMKTTDYVVDGFEEYTSLNVISSMEDEIKRLIVLEFGKAITVYKGERGYLPDSFEVKHDCDIITTVVTRLELIRLKKAIEDVDPKAFIFIQSIKEVKGGIIKQTRIQH
jgi:uncharacterized membrane-anchored protein YitT (DUF2179 family)